MESTYGICDVCGTHITDIFNTAFTPSHCRLLANDPHCQGGCEYLLCATIDQQIEMTRLRFVFRLKCVVIEGADNFSDGIVPQINQKY